MTQDRTSPGGASREETVRPPELIAAFVETNEEPLCLVDPHYRCLARSAGYATVAARLYGADVRPGESAVDAIRDQDDRAAVRAAIAEALGGRPVHLVIEAGDDRRTGHRFEITCEPVPARDGAVAGVVLRVTDVTARRGAEEALRAQRDLALVLGATTDLDAALKAVVSSLLLPDGVDSGGIYLVDPESGDLDLCAHVGLPPAFVAQASHYPVDSPNARLVQAGAPTYQSHAELRALLHSPVSEATQLRAVAVVPIAHDGQVIAALNLASHTRDEIDVTTRLVIETLAADIGGAVARIRAENARLRVRDNLLTLFDSIDDFLFVLDMRGIILLVNPVVLSRLGYTEAELIGSDVLKVHPPERREEAGRIIRAMLSGTKTFCPVPLQARDGTLIPVETRMTAGTWDGQQALFGISRDITARLEAEQALRESDATLRNVIDGTRVGTWDWNVQTGETRFNERWAEIVGCTLADLEPVSIQTWIDLCHPDDLAASNAQLAQVFAGERAHYDLNCRVRHRDGSWVWVLDRGKVIEWTEDGKPARMVGTHADITAEKLVEAEVRALNASLEVRVEERTRELSTAHRDLEEIVYSVSHDLRTPLRAVDGFSHAVLERCGDELGEDGRSDLERVRAAAQRMEALIDALTTLSGSHRRPMHRQEVDLSGIARARLAELSARDPERRVTTRVEEHCVAHADPELAGVVLTALLDNAWKFTSKKATATISFGSTRIDGRRAYYVRDDGAGFDQAYSSQLFRPFHRLHDSREFPGLGAGLAAAGRALRWMGGEYWAEGAPGEGATFYFALASDPSLDDEPSGSQDEAG
jgi:PAS domain S-box-containing protein